MSDEIIVSVYCATYNHEKYIRDALEGFVNQKTSFKYEVWVHDDASTDKTADIVREYENKYPDIIHGYYEKENQYSKGVKILNDIIFPMMRGTYIAYCEGDDYWCDEYKLEKQIDFLNNNTDYVAVAHNSYKYNCNTNEQTVMFLDCGNYDISFLDVLPSGLSRYHISSLVHRREYTIRPEAFYEKNVGDYPQSLYLTCSGKVYFLREIMSVYRYMTAGSFSERIGANIEKMEAQLQEEDRMLKRVDKYTKRKYHNQIRKVIRNHEYNALERKQDYKTICKLYRDVLFGKGKGYYIPVIVKVILPSWMVRCIKKIKKGKRRRE